MYTETSSFAVNWFFVALIGPVLYSAANHIDKYLITKYLQNGSTGALTIFSALFSVVALPAIAVIDPTVLEMSGRDAVVLALNGTLTVGAVLCYFAALQRDEASYVVPFYQTVPLFAFALGYLVLGETISTTQACASLVVVAGTLVLSFDLSAGLRFKRQVVLLMLTASLCYAINGVVFKLIAVDAGFWGALFWSLVGRALVGFALLLGVRSYRGQFVTLFRSNRGPVIGLNAMSESLFIIADATGHYATMLTTVGLAFLVNSLQPLIVFVLGMVLAALAPHLSQETLTRKQMLQKSLGIGTIVLGTLFITR